MKSRDVPIGITRTVHATGSLSTDAMGKPIWNWFQTHSVEYRVIARQAAAQIIDVMVFRRARLLGFSQLRSRSIFTCPSFFSNQAAARNVMATRSSSLISSTQFNGLVRKYLMATSVHTENMRKKSITHATATKPSRIRSKILPNLMASFISCRCLFHFGLYQSSFIKKLRNSA